MSQNKFEFDVDLFKKSGLDLDEFTVLSIIVYELYEEVKDYVIPSAITIQLILDELEACQYIKLGEKIELRQKTIELFSLSSEKVEDWIDKWRELFPAGTNSGGFRYRGDKQECLSKMKVFCKKYKFNKEQIFIATKGYIQRFENSNYNYMKLAHYFIHKQGSGSDLLQEVQSLKNFKEVPKEDDPFVTKV